MSSADRRRVLEAARVVIPRETTAMGFDRDICVLSGWIGRTVLRRFGIEAKPVAVRAIVVNQQHWEDVGEDWERALDEHPDNLSPEAWSVGIGFGEPRKGRWQGHLVLTTRNPDAVLDLTLDQGSRPERGIHLEPFLHEIDRPALQAFEKGQAVLQFVEDGTGTRVAYGMVPGLDMRHGTDWRGMDSSELTSAREELADRIERLIREDIETPTQEDTK